MKTRYRPYTPEQTYLLPPSLQEWLPTGHLSYFISDTVDQLNLRKFKVSYSGKGKDGTVPYDPRMLIKVLLYGYSSGVFSSRRIEKKIYEDVAFRMLAAGNFPSYRTIARFRKENLKAFSDVFTQVVAIAQEAGLVKLGLVAIDGTKIHANASKHKAMSYGRMKEDEERLKGEIKELLARAEAVDAAEENEEDEQIPDELTRRESRLQAIKDAKERLEKRIPKENRTDKSQENFTDPDSRIMKTGGGFEQCYNAQAVVDAEAQIIVAAEVTQAPNDKQQLIPMVEATEAETGELPTDVAADTGYMSEENCVSLENANVRGFIPERRENKKQRQVNADRPAAGRMARRLRGKRGKKKYALRKTIVEPVFGWVKSVLGFRQFLLRGVENVHAEWRLVCTAVNLFRLSHRMKWAVG